MNLLRHVDLIAVLAGIGLLTIGSAAVWLPLGLIVPGALLVYLGARTGAR